MENREQEFCEEDQEDSWWANSSLGLLCLVGKLFEAGGM